MLRDEQQGALRRRATNIRILSGYHRIYIGILYRGSRAASCGAFVFSTLEHYKSTPSISFCTLRAIFLTVPRCGSRAELNLPPRKCCVGVYPLLL